MNHIMEADLYIDTTGYDETEWKIILEPVYTDPKDICDPRRKIQLAARNITTANKYLKVDPNTKIVSATGVHSDPETMWIVDRWADSSLQFITAKAPHLIIYTSNWQLKARYRDKKTDDKDNQTKFKPFFHGERHCTLQSCSTPDLVLAFDDTGRFKDQKEVKVNNNDRPLLLQVLK